jgi:hypothetical protein
MLAGRSVSSFYRNLGNRSKSDPCSYELFCLESHILSFPKVLQIPPASPCILGLCLKMTGDRADKFGNNTKNVSSDVAVFTVTTVRDLLASVNLNFNG